MILRFAVLPGRSAGCEFPWVATPRMTPTLGSTVASAGGRGDPALQASLLRLLGGCVGSGVPPAPAYVTEKLAAALSDLAAREFPHEKNNPHRQWPHH